MAPAIQSLDPERLPKVPLVLNGLSSRFIRQMTYSLGTEE